MTENRLNIYKRPCCTPAGTDPDTNRSVGLGPDLGRLEDGPSLAKGQASGLARPARHIHSAGLGVIAATEGEPEFANCRSDLRGRASIRNATSIAPIAT